MLHLCGVKCALLLYTIHLRYILMLWYKICENKKKDECIFYIPLKISQGKLFLALPSLIIIILCKTLRGRYHGGAIDDENSIVIT